MSDASTDHVVMFVYNDAVADGRVWRAAGALAGTGRRVTVLAHGRPGLPQREDRPEGTLIRVEPSRWGVLPGESGDPQGGRSILRRLRWLGHYIVGHAAWSRRAASVALDTVGDARRVVWHAHDLTGLVPAVRASRLRAGAVVYDSHELFVEASSAARLPSPLRKLLARYESGLASRATALITVSDGIADELARRFRRERPTVVRNVPELGPQPSPRAGPLRHELALGTRPVLLYHGQIALERGVSQAVAALDHLPAEVAFVALGDGPLVPELERLAVGRYEGRLFLHPAVPLEQLPAWIAGADVEVIATPPTGLNHYYMLPNKLFECLAAGVPVVASDVPEMRAVILESDVGITCDPTSPPAIAAAVRSILDRTPVEREELSRRCRAAAEDRYSWARESERLLDVYRGLGTS